MTILRTPGVGTTVRFLFTTNAATGAAVAPSSAFEAADVIVYKDGGATQRSSTSGWTMTSPFDSITGLHQIAIDLSDNTDAGFYAVGSTYDVVLSPDETVDGVAVCAILGSFRIVAAESTAGVPKVDTTHFGGAAGTFSSGRPEVNTTHAAGTAWGSGAITAASIASSAITSAKFAASAIDATAIASNAITSAKIATGAITSSTFAASAINAAAIASDAITAAKIADGAIDAATFAASAINAAAIATGAITAAKFAAGAIDAAALAADAITAAKVAADVTTEIAAGVLSAAAAAPIDCNVQEVNDVALTGDGSATPWGPA